MHIAKQFFEPSFRAIVLCSVICASGSAVQAAGQGAIGPTSTGSVNLSITKTTVARISGLSDMSIALGAPKSDVTWTNDVCIYSSHASGNYTVKAIGSAKGGGAFVMESGKKILPYRVAWNAGVVGSLSNEGVPLSPNAPSAMLNHAATSSNCHEAGGGATARLIISISKSALQLASSGSYADSLTLVVSPS